MKNSFTLLITAPNLLNALDSEREYIESLGVNIVTPQKIQERFTEEELLEMISDADGIVCGDDAYTERVMKSAKRLKVISKWGTGIDSIDQDAARRLGIEVRNVENAFTDPVADHTFAFILAFARQIFETQTEMKNVVWRKTPLTSLSEQTIGIIGLGNIGQAVARRARGFGMNMVGYDVSEEAQAAAAELGVEIVSLQELAKKSDYVSIHCDLNKGSSQLLSRDVIAAMKKGAYVINTARGPIIDEEALIEALQDGNIAGAGLDVFVDEPLPKENPLLSLPNVILSPHNANSSPRSYQAVHRAAVDHAVQVLEKSSVRA